VIGWYHVARFDEFISNGIAGLSIWSSRHARVVMAITIVFTLIFGFGITLITTNVDTADVLPRGNPNTDAAKNLTAQFRSTFTQQVTFQLHVDEEGSDWAAGNALHPYRSSPVDQNNITDEVYLRAMQELQLFVQSQTNFDRTISINNIYALINWTIAGGEGIAEESAFALPPGDTLANEIQYNVVHQATTAAVLETVDTLASPSWNHSVMLFMPASNNTDNIRDLGQSIIDAREAWLEAVENGETVYKIWGKDNPPRFTVDFPVANAHSSSLVEKDLAKLMPVIGVFIVVFLYFAFKDVRAIVISFTSLGAGLVWTYGIMGYLGIALNTLNMTIVPLIMGVGIDYAIHMINEYLEHKANGHSDESAFREAGNRAGLAMFIATMTTVLGLVVMMVSPSLLMAQLGFLSAIAISAIYLITLTFIPAALTLWPGNNKVAKFTPSKIMPAFARGVTKTRFFMLFVVGLLTVGAYMSSLNLEKEAFGDPGKNFPEDDSIRQEHEQGLAYFYEAENPSIKTNILTFEGPNILTPTAMAYYSSIEENLAEKDRIVGDTLRTATFFLETWLTIKNGAPCAAVSLGTADTPPALGPVLGGLAETGAPCTRQVAFPATEAEIREEVRGMFESPMREIASIIMNYPTVLTETDRGMTALTFGVDALTYNEAEEAWNQVQDAINQANGNYGGVPPEGIRVNFVGNTATNYLFVAEQLPWLMYMSAASTIILFILVLTFTRDIKATLVATGLAAVTSLWWFGILPFLDIGLAITLMLPIVFIFNIGTDYVVHMIWNIKKVGNSREVFETTGKAIFFSAITTAGAFAIFAYIQNVAVSRTMIATTIAIGVIFLATMLVVPIFYKVLAPDAVEKEVTLVAAKRRKS
jgi:predicted RND superfamily exporter protein